MPDEITTMDITFDVENGLGQGYLAYSTSPGSHPALIVIQEWWGLDSHIRNITERFARLGFSALAPDLYHGQVTTEPNEARKLAMALEYDTSAKEIDGAANWLTKQSHANGPAFGCIGYCMGGGLVLTTSIRNQNTAASVVYYGGLPNPVDTLGQINSPVLAFYGEDEVNRANEMERILTQNNKSIEMHLYKEASHGFFNDSNPSMFDQNASYDSWPRVINFLLNNLT